MTEQGRLPAELSDFLQRHLHSVAELEALLLARAHPEAWWTGATLAARLYVSDRQAQEVLAGLQRQGLLVRADEGYRYQPASEALREDVERLAVWYPRALIEITRVIHAKPGAAVRGFADAFRLREDR
jgi:hypothetical protein